MEKIKYRHEIYYLKPGYIYVTQEPMVISTVLGSCASICMYDKKEKYGGMNHFLLPFKNNARMGSTKYGNVAIIRLYETFIEFGSKPQDLVARIIGGAYMENNINSKKIAEQNIGICRKMLEDLNIIVIFEDTGGILGRKLLYYTEVNEIEIKKTGKTGLYDYDKYISK